MAREKFRVVGSKTNNEIIADKESTYPSFYSRSALIVPTDKNILYFNGRQIFGVNHNDQGGEIFNDINHNVATGIFAQASNQETTASGIAAQATGYKTVASGNYSMVAGQRSIARHPNSFAIGENCVTNTGNSIAIGKYNVDEKSHTEVGLGSVLYQLGNGNSSKTSDAVRVMQNGDIYIKGINGFQGVNATRDNSLQALLATFVTKSELGIINTALDEINGETI